MSKKRNSALAPRPASAIEKAAPGMKRVLSGMVADSVALAKKVQRSKPRIVVVDDEDWLLVMIERLIHAWFNEVTVLTFQDPDAAWQELSLRNPNLLITRDRMLGLTGEEICRRLFDRKARFPIIVTGGWPPTGKWVREYASRGFNITFLLSPFTVEQFNQMLLTHFGPSDNPSAKFQKSEP